MTRILKGGVGSVNPIVQPKNYLPKSQSHSLFWIPSPSDPNTILPILPLQLPPSSTLALSPIFFKKRMEKKRGQGALSLVSSVTRLETADLWFRAGEVRRRRSGLGWGGGGVVEGSCLPGHLTWKSQKSTDVWRLGDLISAEFRTDGKIRQPHVQMRLERHGYLGCTFLHDWHSRLG